MPNYADPTGTPVVSLRILIAEDTRTPPTRMAQMLEYLGHTVVRAAIGKAVLAQTIEQHFDLIFMDVEMLPLNGAEVTAAVRAHERALGGHVPIIAMSPQAIPAIRDRCLEAGIDRYICKPSTTAELEIVLRAFLDPDSIQDADRPSLWNRTATLERAGGDENSLTELIEVFADESRRLLREMDRAVIAQQSELLEVTALKLGEKLAYLGAVELSTTACQLALSAKKQEFVKAAELVITLESQLVQIDSLMTADVL